MSDETTEIKLETVSYADSSTPRAEALANAGPVTRGDVAALTVRIVGIYVALQGLTLLVGLLPYLFSWNSILIPYTIDFAIYEGIAAVLILKAARIGTWLLPRAADLHPDSSAPAAATELQPVAFSVIGVLLVVWAVPEILLVFFGNGYHPNAAIYSEPPRSDLLISLLRPGVEFVLGLWLFFGSKRLSRYWQHLRAERTHL
jgi:hypothetical protein